MLKKLAIGRGRVDGDLPECIRRSRGGLPDAHADRVDDTSIGCRQGLRWTSIISLTDNYITLMKLIGESQKAVPACAVSETWITHAVTGNAYRMRWPGQPASTYYTAQSYGDARSAMRIQFLHRPSWSSECTVDRVHPKGKLGSDR